MASKVLGLILLLALICSPATAAPQFPIPDDTVISMQRGNCEGGCPVYRILIFANGDAIWHGRGRVARLGVILSVIERDQIRALIRDFDSVDYFLLDNIYGFHGSGCRSSAPDLPMVITSLSMGGRSKMISHHDGCVGEVSEKLSALEDSIDKAVDSARWITGKLPARKP
jgi:hypothetical protein